MTLAGLTDAHVSAESDPLALLRRASGLESVHDPTTRQSLGDALGWACDLLAEGHSLTQIRAQIRTGDDETLLTAPGVHLLTGHVGKGQQFDWVIIVGAEEARVLSIMISRARHGVVLLRAAAVESLTARSGRKSCLDSWPLSRALRNAGTSRA
jgi:DNA helicase II / ATP-dependent DNA helicase PcrA